VCRAAQRQLTGVWLALANMLVIQLDPPASFTVSLRAVPSNEVLTVVRDVVGVLLQATLDTLGVEGGMEAVRGSSLSGWLFSFFPRNGDTMPYAEPRYCARFFQFRGEGKITPLPLPGQDGSRGTQVSYHFVTVFYHLPRLSFDALVQCAISALGLQERYSLVAASTFLVRSSPSLHVSVLSVL